MHFAYYTGRPREKKSEREGIIGSRMRKEREGTRAYTQCSARARGARVVSRESCIQNGRHVDKQAGCALTSPQSRVARWSQRRSSRVFSEKKVTRARSRESHPCARSPVRCRPRRALQLFSLASAPLRKWSVYKSRPPATCTCIYIEHDGSLEVIPFYPISLRSTTSALFPRDAFPRLSRGNGPFPAAPLYANRRDLAFFFASLDGFEVMFTPFCLLLFRCGTERRKSDFPSGPR